MGNGGDSAACNETPLSSFRARQLRALLGMGWVKLVLGVGVAAYSYRSVTHVNSLVRQVTVPKYSLLAKHTQAWFLRTRRKATNIKMHSRSAFRHITGCSKGRGRNMKSSFTT